MCATHTLSNPEGTANWQVRLFGNASISHDGTFYHLPLSTVAGRVLAYLLLHRNTLHERQHLAEIFWPTLTEAQARQAIRRTLWTIRHTLLAPALIEASDEAVGISPTAALWLDVTIFEGILASTPAHPSLLPQANALRPAIQLYTGELLKSVHEEWVYAKRSYFQTLYHQALERLIALEKQAGRYDEALTLARLLLNSDPLNEVMHREVIRLLLILEQPRAALSQLETCRHLMASELGLELEPETLALVYAGGSPPSGAQEHGPARTLSRLEGTSRFYDPHLPLFGRVTERARLLAHLKPLFRPATPLSKRQARSNAVRCPVLFVEGEAGVGKSRLLEEVARDATWRGATVLWGHHPSGAPIAPFQALVEAMQGALSPLRVQQLSQVVDKLWLQVLAPFIDAFQIANLDSLPLPNLEPLQARKRLLDAFAHCLLGWSQASPLLVMVEDIHLADSDTLDALLAIAQRLQGARALLVVTYRSEEARFEKQVWQKIEALDRTAGRDRLLLTGLGAAASAELLYHILSSTQISPDFVAHLYQEAQGNPLFTLEYLRALYEQGNLLQDEHGYWLIPTKAKLGAALGAGPAAVLEQLVARRLANLSSPMRLVLQAAAVIGTRVSLIHLARLVALPGTKLLAILERLVRWHLLVETAEEYHFGHSKIQQMVYEAIPLKERVRLHRVVVTLLAHSSTPDQLAHHCTQGQMWAEATRYYLQAASDERAIVSYQTTLSYYSQALALLTTHHPLAEAESEQCEFDILEQRLNLCLTLGDPPTSQGDLLRLAVLAEKRNDLALTTRALTLKAFYLYSIAAYEESYTVATQALALAQRLVSPAQMSLILRYLGQIEYRRGNYTEANVALAQALEFQQALGDCPAQEAAIRYQRATLYRYTGAIAEAEAECRILVGVAESIHDHLTTARTHQLQGVLAGTRGAYEESCQFMRRAADLAHHVGLREMEGYLLNNLGYFTLLCRDYKAAYHYLEQALRLHHERDNAHGITLGLCNLGSLYRMVGRYGLTHSALHEGVERIGEISSELLTLLLCELLQLALQEQEPTVVQQRADALLAHHQSHAQPSLYEQMYLHHAWGLLAHANDSLLVAIAHFERALQAAQAVGRPDYQARCLSYLAHCFHQQGESVQATAASMRAMENPGAGNQRPLVCFHHWQIMQQARPDLAHQALQEGYELVMAGRHALPDPTWEADYLHCVPLHRHILAAHLAQHALASGTIHVLLARQDVPIGRPLTPDDYTLVTWNLDAAGDSSLADKGERRRHRLLRLLQEAQTQNAAPTVKDLAQALQVSEKTIKRDLTLLRHMGGDTPTRGARS